MYLCLFIYIYIYISTDTYEMFFSAPEERVPIFFSGRSAGKNQGKRNGNTATSVSVLGDEAVGEAVIGIDWKGRGGGASKR